MKYKAGVYRNMSEDHYFNEPTIEYANRSKIVKVESYTPQELFETDSTINSTSPALRLGSALHMLWLEDKKDWVTTKFGTRTKAGKEAMDNASKEGKLLLTTKEEQDVLSWFDIMEENELVKHLRDNLSDAELTILTDDYNGIKAKIRIDGIYKDPETGLLYITDLKTTSSPCTKYGLKDAILKWRYDVQKCMYMDVAKQFEKELGGKIAGWKFVFLSKPQNRARVVTIDNLDMEPLQEFMQLKCAMYADKVEKFKNGIIEKEIEWELF